MDVKEIIELKKEYEDIEIPVYELDNVVKKALEVQVGKSKPRKGSKWKTAVMAAVLGFALISAISITPVGATLGKNIKETINKVVPIFTPLSKETKEKFKNKSVEHAAEQGLGNEGNQSVTDQGITMTLNATVISQDGIVILMSAKSEKHDLEYANVRVGLNDLVDEYGNFVASDAGGGSRYNSITGELNTTYDFGWDDSSWFSAERVIGKELTLKVRDIEFNVGDGFHLSGNWQFKIKVNEEEVELAKSLTKEVVSNVVIVKDEIEYKVEKVVFSPVQIKVYISLAKDERGFAIGDPTKWRASLIDSQSNVLAPKGSECATFDSNDKSPRGRAILSFEPTDDQNISLKIDEEAPITLIAQ